MLLTARISGFLLILLLLAGDKYYAAGDCNLVVSEIKSVEITSVKKIGGRKMVSDRDFMKRETAKDRKRSRILISSENYGARFVAFNADYKGPRHHPPKNN